jgi:hypothetical protein
MSELTLTMWRDDMDIYRELGPKVRPGIEGPYYCASKINLPAWVPVVLIAIMVIAALVWGR